MTDIKELTLEKIFIEMDKYNRPGLNPPEDEEKLQELLKKLKKRGGDEYEL